jgi:hypothetical protein
VTELRACAACLARSWLLARLAPHLEPVRSRIEPLLQLDDQRQALCAELSRFDPEMARERCEAARLESICACDPGFPPQLASLEGRRQCSTSPAGSSGC